MWEVSVLHALSKCGTIRHEDELPSGKRPDIFFEGPAISFIGDITSVSDDGLDERSPFYELLELIEQVKRDLGLPPGGVDLDVYSRVECTAAGRRTLLRLPESNGLKDFVDREIRSLIEGQSRDGSTAVKISLDNDEAGLSLVIDPRKSPYSSGRHASYRVPTIVNRNPLYNALSNKANGQLRVVGSVTGIVVGDGGCEMLSSVWPRWHGIDTKAILREFFLKHNWIDFVLILSVREKSGSRPPSYELHPLMEVRPALSCSAELTSVFEAMIREMPIPIANAKNGALRAKEGGYDFGHHGGGEMSAKSLRVSSRELMELLAGIRTIENINDWHGWENVDGANKHGRLLNPFARHLRDGRLPVSVQVVRTDENDSDDWVEFQFGEPDPAISKLK